MKEPGEYSSILQTQLENKFSIDRLTLLVYSPGFSIHDANENYEDAQGIKTRAKIEAFRSFLSDLISRAKSKNIDADIVTGSIETQLYMYHYRIHDIDVQFCTKLPKTSRVNDEDMIEVFGDEKDKTRGYMFEFYSNDYNVRIEYNPNKADISLLSEVLFFVNEYFYKHYRTAEFIKISRIDLAFDYPLPVNPALIHFKQSRKYNVCGGSEGIETVYYGAQKSTYNLVVYDKKKEFEQKDNVLYPGAYLWRVELRCHNTWFIQDLPGLAGVMQRIEIFSSGLSSGDWCFDLILRDAMHWGIKNSLNMIPDRTKARYLKMFREFSVSPLEHPGDLYFKNFRSVWDIERDKILKTFGFTPDEFCSRAVLDSKL